MRKPVSRRNQPVPVIGAGGLRLADRVALDASVPFVQALAGEHGRKLRPGHQRDDRKASRST
jgi:hypothetical protein